MRLIVAFPSIKGADIPIGVENMERGSSKFDGGRGPNSIHGGEHERGLKMLSKITYEGVYLIVKLPAISLQACKFTENELIHTDFSRILARF